MINTNFGFGNNIKGDEYITKNYASRFTDLKERIQFDKKKRDSYVELVKKMSKELNKTIIFRPHPEEEVKFYTTSFRNLNNVHVLYEGSVIPWIIASDIMIHPDCTTSIEALMLGKESISFLPKSAEEKYITLLPRLVSYLYNDENLLIDFLKNTSSKAIKTDKKKYELLDNYFSYSNNSLEIITSNICSLVKKQTISQQKLKYHQICYLMYIGLKSKINLKKSARLYKNKLSGFNYAELKRIYERISKNTNLGEVNLTPISAELFRFQCKNNSNIQLL